MSKVKQYIEDAVSETAKHIKTKGVEISGVNVDSGMTVNVDNGDLAGVLEILAQAQIEIAKAVVAVSNSKPDINNNSTGIYLKGVDNKPSEFE